MELLLQHLEFHLGNAAMLPLLGQAAVARGHADKLADELHEREGERKDEG